jgi:hypothetical protein
VSRRYAPPDPTRDDGKKRGVRLCPACRAGKTCELAGTKFECKAAHQTARGAWEFKQAEPAEAEPAAENPEAKEAEAKAPPSDEEFWK